MTSHKCQQEHWDDSRLKLIACIFSRILAYIHQSTIEGHASVAGPNLQFGTVDPTIISANQYSAAQAVAVPQAHPYLVRSHASWHTEPRVLCNPVLPICSVSSRKRPLSMHLSVS